MPKLKISTAAPVTKEEVNLMIRKKAQELFEKSGRKSGRDLDNWLEAERIVKAQLKKAW